VQHKQKLEEQLVEAERFRSDKELLCVVARWIWRRIQ
jgi:hypothetical protein